MALTFEQIHTDIKKIRNYIFNDLKLIVTQEQRGNYATVAIMMSTCDLLARLRYGKKGAGATFVTNYMGKNEIDSTYSKIGKTLYEALRHGVVHSYETKKVQIGRTVVDFGISWRKEPHFSVDRQKWIIHINVPVMLDHLKRAFDLYVEDLKRAGELRDRFLLKLREEMTMPPKDKNEGKALLAFFG